MQRQQSPGGNFTIPQVCGNCRQTTTSRCLALFTLDSTQLISLQSLGRKVLSYIYIYIYVTFRRTFMVEEQDTASFQTCIHDGEQNRVKKEKNT